MAFGSEGIDVTYRCATDLSTKQYYAVYLSGNHTVALAGANAKVVGILQNKPDGTAGESALVRIMGLSKHVMGEASLTVGDVLTSTAAGKGEQADAAGEWVYGVITDSGDNTIADGDVATIQLIGGAAAHASDA